MTNSRNFVLDMHLKKLERDAMAAWSHLTRQTDLFPQSICKFGAIALHHKGYPIVRGVVVLDDYCGLGNTKELTHFWNYDIFSRHFIDISASQFNSHQTLHTFSDILIWNSENPPQFARIYSALKTGLQPEELLG